jgi:hypothetical protein
VEIFRKIILWIPRRELKPIVCSAERRMYTLTCLFDSSPR